MTEQTPPGNLSADGMWVWDGHQWGPSAKQLEARARDAHVGKISVDGKWQWDGSAWQPVPTLLTQPMDEPERARPDVSVGGKRRANSGGPSTEAASGSTRQFWEKAEVNRFAAKFAGARLSGEFVQHGSTRIPVLGAQAGVTKSRKIVDVTVTGAAGQSIKVTGPIAKIKEAETFARRVEQAAEAAVVRTKASEGDPEAQRQLASAVAVTRRTGLASAVLGVVLVVGLGSCIASAGDEQAPVAAATEQVAPVELGEDKAQDRADREQRQAERKAEKAAAEAQAEMKQRREERAARQQTRRQAKAEAQREAVVKVSYANCTEVEAAGAAPIFEGDPGYSTNLDRDGDGIACDQ